MTLVQFCSIFFHCGSFSHVEKHRAVWFVLKLYLFFIFYFLYLFFIFRSSLHLFFFFFFFNHQQIERERERVLWCDKSIIIGFIDLIFLWKCHYIHFQKMKTLACLVNKFKLLFSVFKQHYTHFHILFHPHVFQKTTNNITQTSLPNGPKLYSIFAFKSFFFLGY